VLSREAANYTDLITFLLLPTDDILTAVAAVFPIAISNAHPSSFLLSGGASA
jgi:hypothetical protein